MLLVNSTRSADEIRNGKSKDRRTRSGIEFTHRSAHPISDHVSLPSFFYWVRAAWIRDGGVRWCSNSVASRPPASVASRYVLALYSIAVISGWRFHAGSNIARWTLLSHSITPGGLYFVRGGGKRSRIWRWRGARWSGRPLEISEKMEEN